ncbi:MAG: glutamine cyclotransferase [Alcanivorax sp.]|nr:glutamine cyclotransferase [Alcanivorax sp.]
MNIKNAEITREYGPFEGAPIIHGIEYDGHHLWLATGERLQALNPTTGRVERHLDVAADAGTAFDGHHLYQIAEARIQKIDPRTGEVLTSVPAPGNGEDSGMAWAEGFLWIGQYRQRRIHQVDPDTGAILRTLESDRFVTGVTWVDDALWHGTGEGDAGELRRLHPESGEVLDRLRLPDGVGVSGLTHDGNGGFYCGGGPSGRVRAVARR